MIGDILQPTHLLFVLVVALLVLGPKRLPEVGRSLGRGLRDFRSAISGEDNDRHDEIQPPAGVAVPPVDTASAAPVDPQHTASTDVAQAPSEPVPVPAAPAHAAPAQPVPDTADHQS